MEADQVATDIQTSYQIQSVNIYFKICTYKLTVIDILFIESKRLGYCSISTINSINLQWSSKFEKNEQRIVL